MESSEVGIAVQYLLCCSGAWLLWAIVGYFIAVRRGIWGITGISLSPTWPYRVGCSGTADAQPPPQVPLLRGAGERGSNRLRALRKRH